ncbi:MAG: tryptophan synthase subunit beta [Verrucomicrobiota bacterium]|nr:tryptophan synthase subunit beta [Verrucomicrobiota bacterium]
MLVKICGLMDPKTARFAVQKGAHFIGLLFSKVSPRAISLEKAKEIVRAVREEGGEPVAVFADESLTEMRRIIQELSLNVVQLHGDIPRSFCDQIPQTKIYVADGKPYPKSLQTERDYLLFEQHIQDPQGFRFFMAGGLTPENVARMIETYHPHGVDVSRGARDETAIGQFIAQARPGRFGAFGGTYVPEGLIAPLKELEKAFREIPIEEEFLHLLRDYAGRPTAITEIPNFAKAIGGPRIFLKREDLLHTGAHKINNAIGQCLLAKKMGKTRIIAETGAGQHGVATATACALLGLECVVYMGQTDIERQSPNVFKMKLLGAQVVPVTAGSQTLKDAVNEALRDYAARYETTHYCLGSALGPHPFPAIVEKFQQVIGQEAKKPMRDKIGRDPDVAIACVGGGSNAIGLFSAYLDEKTALIGVEAAGAARFQKGGSPGMLHGTYSYLLQDDNGQVQPTHSISAGLDYPGVGPKHADLFAQRRVKYDICTDAEALAAFQLLCRTEGIIPALESSHALGYLMRIAKDLPRDAVVLVNLSGRGDKDVAHIQSLCQ